MMVVLFMVCRMTLTPYALRQKMMHNKKPFILFLYFSLAHFLNNNNALMFIRWRVIQQLKARKKRMRPPLQRLSDHTLAQAEPKLYFYHHAGLNTFWKPSQNKDIIPPNDASDLVMQAALKRANLPKQYF